MDLYLMSPVFLRKMIRSSCATSPGDSLEIKDIDLDDLLAEREEASESESEAEADHIASYNHSERRRSSLDRMLRQNAYIIICLLCYACTLPGQVT